MKSARRRMRYLTLVMSLVTATWITVVDSGPAHAVVSNKTGIAGFAQIPGHASCSYMRTNTAGWLAFSGSSRACRTTLLPVPDSGTGSKVCPRFHIEREAATAARCAPARMGIVRRVCGRASPDRRPQPADPGIRNQRQGCTAPSFDANGRRRRRGSQRPRRVLNSIE